MTDRPRGQRRVTLPGWTRPPANPPLGTLPTDDLFELDQAEREDLLAGRVRDPWDAHDAHMQALVAQWRRAHRTPDLDALVGHPAQEESA